MCLWEWSRRDICPADQGIDLLTAYIDNCLHLKHHSMSSVRVLFANSGKELNLKMRRMPSLFSFLTLPKMDINTLLNSHCIKNSPLICCASSCRLRCLEDEVSQVFRDISDSSEAGTRLQLVHTFRRSRMSNKSSSKVEFLIGVLRTR